MEKGLTRETLALVIAILVSALGIIFLTVAPLDTVKEEMYQMQLEMKEFHKKLDELKVRRK